MLDRFVKDFKKYFQYSIVSARAQLRTEVANSYLNWIWWVLEPVCFMLIYTFVFGYVFKVREPYFPVFIYIGLSVWDFFSRTVKQSVRLVKNNKGIVSKVYMPKFILILTKLWVNAFKMMVSFGLVIVLMIVYQVPVTWNVFYFIPLLATVMLFTFGCSTFFMHYGVYVQDLANVTDIMLKMLFYVTGIFYNVAKRIPGIGEVFNKVNPLAFLITSMRECVIYGHTPHRKLMLVWITVSAVITILGIRKIYKNENSYVKLI